MLLAHARAVAAAWWSLAAGDGGFDPVRPLVLTLAAAFFVLKLLDAPWLRFRTDRRSVATLVLVVVVLHVQTLGLTADNGLIPQAVAAASAVLFLEPVQRRWEQVYVRIFAQSAPGPSSPRPSPRLLDTLIAAVQRWPQWLIVHTATPPRGPPA
jgi:hypothetical protein